MQRLGSNGVARFLIGQEEWLNKRLRYKTLLLSSQLH